jgi:hypothetical protein
VLTNTPINAPINEPISVLTNGPINEQINPTVNSSEDSLLDQLLFELEHGTGDKPDNEIHQCENVDKDDKIIEEKYSKIKYAANELSKIIEGNDIHISRDINIFKLEVEEIFSEYNFKVLASSYEPTLSLNNIADSLDFICYNLRKICEEIEDQEFSARERINGTNECISMKISSIKKLIIDTKKLEITREAPKTYDICQCGQKMILYSSSSELRCEECGLIRKLQGIGFIETQSNDESTSYKPLRHFRSWMDCIQAREKFILPDNEASRISAVIERDGIPNKKINCRYIRRVLKDLGLTQYNKNAPMLVKIFSGGLIVPPRLSFNDIRLFEQKFVHLMKVYHSLYPDIEKKQYYPSFIAEIAKDVFQDNPEKLKILDFIYLQSDKTRIKHKKIYNEIINEMMKDNCAGIKCK